MSGLHIHLLSENLSQSALQDRVRALGQDIERHADANTEIPTGAKRENTKGEPITLGVLLVTFMTSGAAVAALNVLKSYLERDRSMSMEIEKPDGTKITLTAADMKDVKALAGQIVDDAAGS